MTDKEGKIISPAEFVPIAEQDGTILRIGLYVYEEVCKFIATKKLQNYGIKMIDVNLSVAQCMQNRIAEEFKDILESYSLDPKQVVLEITETANAHTPELLYSNMQKLHEIGFPCSLDDYGTGNANIEYILHMPFSMIKIDKEIVHTAMKDEKAYVMLVGIMDMIHSLNMKSVAEGIETQEMVDKLSSLKCDYLQGFYDSRPIPEDQFMKLIESQKIQEEKTILEEFNHMTQSKADDNVELLEPFEELESVDD